MSVNGETEDFEDFESEGIPEGSMEKVYSENQKLRIELERISEELNARKRELEIDAGLEKVRATAMAMHKSRDLRSVVQILYDQLRDLGFQSGVASITIMDPDTGDIDWWMEGFDAGYVLPERYHVSFFDHPGHQQQLAHWKSGTSFAEIEISGHEKKTYDAYYFFKTDFALAPESSKQLMMQQESVRFSMAYMKYGALSWSPSSLSQDQTRILERFAKVFEQCYTRFLDLQKAEAQAREAQIEAALERVRAKAMAMHKSDELTDVASLLFRQIRGLGITAWTTGFNIWSEDNNSYVDYVTDPEGNFIEPYTVDTTAAPVLIAVSGAKKAGLEFFVNYEEGEAIKETYRVLTSFGEEGQYEKLLESGFQFPSQQYEHFVFGSKVSLLFITYEPVPEAHDIFKRFGKVFEQTYTRFLDLQKAEGQVREAQIEAALERIRARAMAMHHSGELRDVLTVLFNQFDILGIKPVQAQLSLFDLENNRFTFRSTGKGGRGIIGEQIIDMDAMDTWKETIDKWKRSQPNSINSLYFPKETLPQLWALFDDLSKQLPEEEIITQEDFPDGVYVTEGNFNYGYIGFSHNRKATPEEEDIVIRVATEFGRLYQRFLDLQKAEAQAREAQIQLSLERIRAKAMAMQHSDELSDFLTVLFDQFNVLNLNPVNCHLNFLDIENNRNTFRITGKRGAALIATQEIDLDASPLWKKRKEDWKAGHPNDVDVLYVPYENRQEIGEIFKELLSKLPEEDRPLPEDFPDGLYVIDGYCRYGYLGYSASKPPSDEEKEITRRIAHEFGNVYQRFLDLEKAESQAREAQIQLSLERIRAKAMSMQHSDELSDFLTVVFEQFHVLNLRPVNSQLSFLDIDNNRSIFRLTGKNGATLIATQEVDLDASPIWKQKVEDFKSGQPKDVDVLFVPYDMLPEIAEIFKEILAKLPEDERPLPEDYPNGQYIVEGTFKYGYLGYSAVRPPSEEEKEITRRIANEFGNVYQRFLDLEKAEAQARESEIEVALEKVRSRSLAMHKSDELKDVVFSVFERLRDLQIQTDSTNIVVYFDEIEKMEFWTANDMNYAAKFSLPMTGRFYPIEGIKARNEQKFFLQHLSFEEKNRFWEELFQTADFQKVPEIRKIFLLEKTDCLIQLIAFGKFTGIMLNRHFNTPFSDAEIEIAERFSKVFDQAYTRFLDLQKAEAQTREAQIQLSLERVRARTMAMQSSEELAEVSYLLNKQIVDLGIPTRGCAFNIYGEHDSTEWFSNLEGTIPTYKTPRENIFLKYYEAGQRGESLLIEEFGGERIKELYRYFASLNNSGDEKIDDHVFNPPDYQISHMAYFKYGYLLFVTLVPAPEAHEVFKRFAKEFEQTYTRFLDLQKAEAQAREATKQASLDRVRGVIASMRSATDLELITPLIFRELTILGVPFIRCGVFIINEKQEIIEAYLSSPDGNSLGALRLPFNASELTYKTVEAWRKGVVFRQHWNKEDFIQWIKQLMEQDQIQDSRTYQGAAAPPESLDLHFVPFTQGMLYVGAVNPLDEKELELVQALAKAFSIAYARYEDFVKLEQAKVEVESAMTELKATQSQLVQQEKLASLGQLTAGIAHEIKNPLNFVNNFSEVSMELVDDAIEERSKSQEARDETLVDEILVDIKSNLEKVHEHGTRANSIVSSMLQHSRGGSGKMEPTDLNALIKEYVNLSFHGMRAGKNPIDVEIELHLDQAIKEVPLIKEDFTRVIINLCNNAFDAMRGKILDGLEGYHPSLKVSTSQLPPEGGKGGVF